LPVASEFLNSHAVNITRGCDVFCCRIAVASSIQAKSDTIFAHLGARVAIAHDLG
jgi:hypothetical protein